MSQSRNNRIFERRKCLSKNEVGLYVQGGYSPKERNHIEKHMIDCAICSDAMEGYILVPSGLVELDKMRGEEQVKTGTGWGKYLVAASLVGAALLIFTLIPDLNNKQLSDNVKQEKVAKQEDSDKKEIKVLQDSTAVATVSPKEPSQDTDKEGDARDQQAVKSKEGKKLLAKVSVSPVTVIVQDETESAELADNTASFGEDVDAVTGGESVLETGEAEADELAVVSRITVDGNINFQQRLANVTDSEDETTSDITVVDDAIAEEVPMAPGALRKEREITDSVSVAIGQNYRYDRFTDSAGKIDDHDATGGIADDGVKITTVDNTAITLAGSDQENRGKEVETEKKPEEELRHYAKVVPEEKARKKAQSTSDADLAEDKEMPEQQGELLAGSFGESDLPITFIHNYKVYDYTKEEDRNRGNFKDFSLKGVAASEESNQDRSTEKKADLAPSKLKSVERTKSSLFGKTSKNNVIAFDALEEQTNISYVKFLEEALLQLSSKNYARALSDFATITETYPEDLNAKFYSGLIHYDLHNNRAAIKYFDRLLTDENVFTEEAEIYKAKSLQRIGENEAAKKVYRKVIERNSFYKNEAEKIMLDDY